MRNNVADHPARGFLTRFFVRAMLVLGATTVGTAIAFGGAPAIADEVPIPVMINMPGNTPWD
ncbi:hypothetical protein AB0K40_45455 [Nonomuraea bangladeshensis]|uniref:Uncharacterized protein n=1 Tax=Nonomuraea bangladeshensis TaxID=404385 RepID=A0ABV3HJS5_9ACTN